MNLLLALIICVLLLILLLPLAKVYQLKAYNCKNFIESIFQFKYSFKGKNKLVLTKRMFRFLALFVILEFVLWHFLIQYLNLWWLLVLDFLVNLLLLPSILVFLHYFLLPFELIIKKHYIFRTKKILKNFKGVKIAITGSFGKTSTKEILTQMLSKKFKVLSTPKNFNTPMGLSKTILGGLKEGVEILIVEMGARHKGDIKELCEILKPDIGIVTSVGAQHLETFGSLENVIKTKGELCQSLSPNKVCFFDCYNENTLRLYKSSSCKKKSLGREWKISDIELTIKGLKFRLSNKQNVFSFSTKLLGAFSSRNISLCAMVANYLGVEKECIEETVSNLSHVMHRLQLIKTNKMTIIDDSYNSNYDGFNEALSVLKMFKGKKVIVTPGIVELGPRQYEINYKIGKKIAEVCDVAIVMNKTNKKALTEGMKSGERKIKICFADTREEQKEQLSETTEEGAAILFENDLPDDYA